jgi:hypothetical protein
MDRRERAPNLEEVILSALDARQSRLWTMLVGVVQSYNPATRTAVVQPAVNGALRQPDGTWNRVQLPLLLDCPVVFPSGGGVTLTFPVTQGDECLLFFCSRCIDNWYARGYLAGTAESPNPGNDPSEYRMHNLSDGFALVGVRSLARALPTDPLNAVLTTDDGLASISVNPTSHAIAINTSGALTITAAGGITMNNVTIDASSNFNTPGLITGQGIVEETHTHISATPGSPTSPPVAS